MNLLRINTVFDCLLDVVRILKVDILNLNIFQITYS